MTGKRVGGKQNDVREQHQGTSANAEVFTGWRVKPKRDKRIVPEDEQEDDSDVQEIAMEILQNERKSCLTAISMSV